MSIIFFLVFCFLFLTLYRQIESHSREAGQNLALWQTEALKRDNLRELYNSMKMIEVERAELEKHFAKSSDVVPFLDTVERLARDTGAQAEITSVNVLGDKTGLSVGVKASGAFTALYKFIKLLENSPYELEFVSMDLRKVTASDSQNAGWNLSLGITLISFIQ